MSIDYVLKLLIFYGNYVYKTSLIFDEFIKNYNCGRSKCW